MTNYRYISTWIYLQLISSSPACTQNQTYGANCNMKCDQRYCVSMSSCDVQTGSCGNDGCIAGSMGVDCTQGRYLRLYIYHTPVILSHSIIPVVTHKVVGYFSYFKVRYILHWITQQFHWILSSLRPMTTLVLNQTVLSLILTFTVYSD